MILFLTYKKFKFSNISLVISAFHELIKWLVSLNTGESGDDFLGTRGDIWDAQTDMLTAQIGATLAVLLFSKIQKKSISRLNPPV
ncbi:DUF2238 domain-containing protein [Pedobacter sp. JCM 36344]|uniref:DUF2238 domain-containing protein n=1 Tax=Pedobacter sp. JCM 36344 TaxID=3374280 RepID=UPI00397B20A8